MSNDTNLPYFRDAIQRYDPDKVLELSMHYYYTVGKPLGDRGVGLWLFFGQQTMRN